jgi:hypothetical protein
MSDATQPWPDDIDEAILDQLRALHTTLDPPPADLATRVRFAIAVDRVDFEIARLSDDLLVGSGARGVERTRTVTFDSESLTIMLSIVETARGRLRVDGWLAPPGPHRVELRSAGSGPRARATAREVTADDAGRFVFDGVTRGPAQVLVHMAADGRSARPAVVTPSLLL